VSESASGEDGKPDEGNDEQIFRQTDSVVHSRHSTLMAWIVQRRWTDPQSVTGELLRDGVHRCWTLEPPYKRRKEDGGTGEKPRAIPAGTYDLTVRPSQRFGRLMPHVENVPDFQGVLIHWGNFPKDTEGCTLVGTAHSANFVGHSREEFDLLFREIQEACESGPQTITYVDPPPVRPNVDGEIGT